MELTVAGTKIGQETKFESRTDGLTVKFGDIGARTRIVSALDVTSWVGCPVGSGALVAGDLRSGGFASRELEEITGVGWIAKVTVEPPFFEGEVDERSDRSIVVRESLCGDVEAVHARMPDRGMGVHVASGEQRKERKCRERDHRKLNQSKREKERKGEMASPVSAPPLSILCLSRIDL